MNATPTRAMLTPRQIDIVLRVGDGQTVEEISQALRLTGYVVRHNLSDAYAVLGARNAAQAVAELYRLCGDFYAEPAASEATA